MAYDANAAERLILARCAETESASPVEIALALMHRPEIRMHGPEHHLLTAASLCAAWCAVTGERREEHLERLRARCALIHPGVCGYYGVCGDTLAAGAFLSEMLDADYLSGREWKTINEFTARMQRAAADAGSRGPRCCKRTTLAVLLAAPDALAELTGIRLAGAAYSACEFRPNNPQCIGSACRFCGGEAKIP